LPLAIQYPATSPLSLLWFFVEELFLYMVIDSRDCGMRVSGKEAITDLNVTRHNDNAYTLLE
jgi:ammonia channel protein AmtB